MRGATRSIFYPTALVVLSIGLTLTSLGAWLLSHANDTQMNRAVDDIEQATINAVIKRIELYQYGLRGARGAVLVAGEDKLTLKDFKRYSESRDIAKEFPGARGFGFIRRVAVDDEADFLARAHADAGPTYTLTYQYPHAGDRLYIQYIEPVLANNAAMGFDIASEPHRQQAAQEAIDSGEMRLTQPITLMQEPSKSRQSFLVLMPVYRGSLTPASVQQRREQLIGLTYAPLLMTEVLQGLRIDSRLLHVQLSDHSDTSQPPVIFFSNHDGLPPHIDHYWRRFEQRVFGREWSFELSVTPEFITAQRLVTPLWIVAGGGLASLILAGLAGAIAVSRVQRREIDTARVELLTARDIAQQKAQNEALKDQLLLAADAAELGIWTLDPNDRSMSWNARMFSLYDLRAESTDQPVTWEAWASRLYPDDIPRCEEALQRMMDGVNSSNLVFRARLANGELRHIHSSARMQRDSEGRPTLITGINRDITLQHEIEATLRQAKASADRASASKSSFLANMSHEIRTPLNAVLGMLQLVEHTALDPLQRDYILKARQAARSLLGLLNDILDYSKIEASKLALDVYAFVLDELLADLAVISAGNQHTSEVATVFDIDPAVPGVLLGDGQRLKQVLVNLVGNALKFTLQGEVVIGLTIIRREGSDITLGFSVRDTGIGISAEQREHIFEGFNQAEASTSRRFGGTGLGLVISKRLVTLMGGELQLDSRVGVGSCFSFALPFTLAHTSELPLPSPPQRPPGPTVANRRLAGKHVLVVEDNMVNRQVANGMLNLEGATVTLAGNGLEALAALNDAPTRYHAVLMDMQMPEMDGLEATRNIRMDPRFETLPIIAMTANASTEDRLACLAAGMNDHISKPMELATLSQCLGLWVHPARGAAPVSTIAVTGDPLLEPWTTVAGRFGGDPDLLRNVTAIFAQDTRELLARLDALAHNGDRATARAILHAIKGSAANVGAKALSHATARLAAQLEQGDREVLEALATGALARHLTVLLDASEVQIRTRQ